MRDYIKAEFIQKWDQIGKNYTKKDYIEEKLYYTKRKLYRKETRQREII